MADGTALPVTGPPAEAADDAEVRNARIGERLLSLGLLSPDQLHVALLEKKGSDRRLGEILVAFGFITEAALSQALADSAGLQRFDPAAAIVDPALARAIPREVAARHKVLPVSISASERTLRVAMADVHDIIALDRIRRHFPADYRIEPMVCADSTLADLIDHHFGFETSIDGILREIETGAPPETPPPHSGPDAYRNPTVRLVNAILVDAVKQEASDLHFEPEGAFVRLRYRIDGVLHPVRTFHRDYWSAIAVRVKVMSDMNIADSRNPQDGRFSYSVGGREVDFRAATLPTVHGENIVLRVLDKTRSLLPLEGLGFGDANIALLKRLLMRPEGLVLVTGPTGSGKTTTLYSMLAHVSTTEVNVMTLEDPVEYRLPLIRQSEIREGTNLDFVDGTRSILRQDPDIILIGEIRDHDTAQMAMRAAITGHRVFTTLHTNDAIGAVSRLIDIGVPPYMLSGNIICVIAQRLARRLCMHCRLPTQPDTRARRILGLEEDSQTVIFRAGGCADCRHTGYRGRVAIAEVLPFDDDFDEQVGRQATRSTLRANAVANGFEPMMTDGIAKVLAGVTSIDELVKTVDMTARL